MITVTVITILFAVGFLSFGWQIAFRREFYLVRGYKKGAERYARAVGTLLFAGGVLTACVLPPLIYFAPTAAPWALTAAIALTLVPVWVLVRRMR